MSEKPVTTNDKVCAKCGERVFYDNGDVTFHCSCNAEWVFKND